MIKIETINEKHCSFHACLLVGIRAKKNPEPQGFRGP